MKPAGHRSVAIVFVSVLILAGVLLACVVPAAGASRRPAPAGRGTAWTVMVYLDGDNNLDPWAQYTVDLMVQGLAASNRGNVSVVVLWDHPGATGGEKGVVTASGYRKIADVPEPDMSSGTTLAQFIGWAMRAYPAERYVLNMWDHGSGWVYLASDDTTEAAGTSPSGGRMLVADLATGIAAGEATTGRRIDMVLFEMCNMGMVEVSYQLRSLCGYVVATELTQDFEGIPWNTTVRDLDLAPGMTTAALGKIMVDQLVLSYQTDNKHAKAIATLSCIDQTKQEELVRSMDGLSLALMADMKHWQGAVNSAQANAKDQIWGTAVNGINWFADVYKFAFEVSKQIDDPTVDLWADRVTSAVSSGLYTQHSKNTDGKLYGITVSFPPNKSAYDMHVWALPVDYASIGLDFTRDTNWDEMLRAYYVASGRL